MTANASGAVKSVQLKDIRTPRSGGGLLLAATAPRIAARLGVKLLRKPLRFGKIVVAARHRDVREVLERDLDFRIAPVNSQRVNAVNGGPFILGMDRSDTLTTERRALYSALATVDLAEMHELAAKDADALIATAKNGKIDAVNGYARIVAGKTAQRLFGIAGPDEAVFREVARAIFAHTFLNLGDKKDIRDRALKAGGLMRTWLDSEIARRRASGLNREDLMGALLRQQFLDDDGVRRTLGGMFVGSIDTTATAVAKILATFARSQRLRDAARADLAHPALMLGWCREALRLWPHNPVILRKTVAPTTLNGVAVAAGSQVFAWTQAAMEDSEAFPEPRRAQPDRPAAAYLHFGGGLHPCAGRAVNDVQIPMLVSKLLGRMTGVGSVSWAGPFPDELQVRFK